MIDCLWLSVDRLKSTFYRVLLSRRFAPSAGESWTQKGKKLVACLEWTHAVAVILAERDRRRDLPHITWWAKTGRDSPIKGRRLLGLGKDVSCLVRKKSWPSSSNIPISAFSLSGVITSVIDENISHLRIYFYRERITHHWPQPLQLFHITKYRFLC